MWKPFKCRLFRDHDYQLRRLPGALFLECKRCGHRTNGWNLSEKRVNRADIPLRLFIADSGEARRAVRAADRKPAIWPAVIDTRELRLTYGRED
jgi:hypothetical protein